MTKADHDEVTAYLEATRGVHSLSGSHPTLSAHYQRTYQELASLLGEMVITDVEPPPLTVVHSPLAHAETMSTDRGPHLIYDQYLGQMLNRLNRLYLENSGRDEMNAYLHKVCASRALASGKPDRALMHAFIYAAVSSRITPAPQGEAAILRMEFTASSEAFVLAHELVHCLYQAQPDVAAEAEQYCIDLVAIQWRLGDIGGTQALVRKLLHQATLAFESRRTGTAHSTSIASPLTQSRLRPEFTFIDSEMLREEHTCDSLAVLITTWWAIKHGLNVADAVCASVVSLFHLRLIRLIDAMVKFDGENYNEDWMKTLLDESSQRIAFFISSTSAWLFLSWPVVPSSQMKARSMPNADNLMIAVCATIDRYEKTLYDYVKGDFVADFTSQRAAWPTDLTVRLLPGEDPHDAVRRLCSLP
jgi:hypothetical protein